MAVVSLKRTDRWKDRQSRLVEMGREASGTNFSIDWKSLIGEVKDVYRGIAIGESGNGVSAAR